MQVLPEPVDGKTQVLRKMLTDQTTTFKDYPTGFRLSARIWDLRKKQDVDITMQRVPFKNRHKHAGTCAKYSVVITSAEEKKKLIEKYLSLVKKKPQSDS